MTQAAELRFLPASVVAHLAGDRSATSIRQGAVGIFDAVGFTALTEELEHRGRDGAERMSSILNRYFELVATEVAAGGGEIVHFAGDAVMAVWDGDDAARRAVRVGRVVQTTIEAADMSGLGLTVTVASGEMAIEHLEAPVADAYVLTGSAVDALAGLAPHARPSHVVATSEVGRQLGRHDVRADVVTITDLPAASSVPARRPPPAVDPDAVRRFLVAPVLERLDAGQDDWLGEYRSITVLFVPLGGRRAGGSAAADAYRVVADVTAELDGTVANVTADEKGPVALCAFGLPGRAHEDGAARGLRAAVRLNGELARSGLAASVGVATGRVFCGVFGGRDRLAYTVIGSPVNRAARLMAVTADAVRCDAATVASSGVEARPLGPHVLKGLDEPVEVFEPTGGPARRASRGHGSLVGRSTELRAVCEVLDAARNGRRGLAVVTGEAGIGKSSLVRAAVAQTTNDGGGPIRILETAGDSIASAANAVWRAPLIDALGPGAADSPDELQRRIAELGIHPLLAPLLEPLLPLGQEESGLTAGLSGDARAERTRGLIVAILSGAARERPIGLVVEDVHWLDSVSWSTLSMLLAADAPLGIVVTTRPSDRTIDPDAFGPPVSADIELGNLGLHEVRVLVATALGVEAVSDEVSDFLTLKSSGHPLFAQELARSLVAAGHARSSDGSLEAVRRGRLGDVDAPLTVEGVVTSRFDQVDPSAQLTAKVASVIGPTFARQTLAAVHPLGPSPEDLDHDLTGLLDERLIDVRPDGRFDFVHAVVCDVAYELLTFEQRRAIHREMVSWYDRRADELDVERSTALAHHWYHAIGGEAADADRLHAIDALRTAAEDGLAACSHVEAARHLERGLATADGAAEHGEEFDEAEFSLQSLHGYALMNMRGYGDPEVEQAYRRCAELARELPPSSDRGPALYGLFSFYASTAEYPAGLELAKDIVDLGERFADDVLRLIGYNSLGLAEVLRGDIRAGAAHCCTSREMADAHPSGGFLPQYGGDFRGYPRTWEVIATCLLGRTDDAQARFDEALRLTQWHPYTHAFVLAFGALPQLLGDVDATRRRADDLVELSQSYDFMMLGAIGRLYRSWADAVSSSDAADVRQAVEQLEGAMQVPIFVQLESFLPWYRAMLAEAQLAAADVDGALVTLDGAIERVRSAGGSFYEPELRRLRGVVLHRLGREADARTALAGAQASADRMGAVHWSRRVAATIADPSAGRIHEQELRT